MAWAVRAIHAADEGDDMAEINDATDFGEKGMVKGQAIERSIDEIRAQLNNRDLLIVPYMHGDWAWCHTRLWHEIRYVAVVEDVVAVFQKHPEYRWYMDCYATVLAPVIDRAPHLLPCLEKLIKDGIIDICGGFSNLRPNMEGDEAYVRNMIIGRKRFEELFPGVSITVQAEAVDVALGHAQIPQLIKKGGFKFYRAGRPYDVLAKKGLPRTFLWQGLDGTLVPVWWGDYGGIVFKETVDKLLFDEEHWEETVIALYDDVIGKVAQTTCSQTLLIPQGCDDNLPLKAFNLDLDVDLPQLIKTWNERETSRMRFATPTEFFSELGRMGEFQTYSGAIDICDVCYNVAYGGEKSLKALRSKQDALLTQAEKWSTIAELRGYQAAPDTEPMWEKMLISAAHATSWVFTNDFNEIYEMALHNAYEAMELIRKAQREICKDIELPTGTLYVVFNMSQWETEAIIELTLPCGGIEELALIDGDGLPLPFQVLKPYEYTDTVWEYEAAVKIKLPPFGYNTIIAKSGSIDGRYGAPFEKMQPAQKLPCSGSLRIEAGRMELEFCNGDLISAILDGTPVAHDGGIPFNSLHYNEISKENAVLHVGVVTESIRVKWNSYCMTEQGPLRHKIVLFGSDGRHEYRQEIAVPHHRAQLEISVSVDWRRSNGFLTADIPLANASRLHGGIPFGIEEKDIASEPYVDLESDAWDDMHRKRKGLFVSKDFVSAMNDSETVTLSPGWGDRFYIHDANSNMLSYVLLNSIELIPDTWEDNVNLFSTESIGPHVFEYVVSVDRERDLVQIHNESISRKVKPIVHKPVREVMGHPSMPLSGSFMSCDLANIVVSAFYKEDGVYTLRLWESAGVSSNALIDLPKPFVKAYCTDFTGNIEEGIEKEKVQLEGRTLSISVKPYEIITIKLWEESL